MNPVIATNIETSLFYSIVEFLKETGWELELEYDENCFDKAIDFDLYQFSKHDDKILLAWNNWFEGEIKTTTRILEMISDHFKIKFSFGEPEYLHRPELVTEMEGLLKFKK